MPDLAFGYVCTTLNRILLRRYESHTDRASVQALRMVIIGVISVNGAAPIIKVGIHWRIGVHIFRYL